MFPRATYQLCYLFDKPFIDLASSAWSIFLDRTLAHSGVFYAFDTGGATNDISRIRLRLKKIS